MFKLRIIVVLSLLLAFVNGCVPYRRTLLVQDEGKRLPLKEFQVDRQIISSIQPGDELYINVSTSDERPTNFTTQESFIDVELRSYTVSNDGLINFPYLGEVFVQGKSLEEAAAEIQEALTNYIYTPSVYIKFVNKKVTVIGEVNSPGVYNFFDKNINVLQAIAYAGDISTFGNRKQVVLIRELDGRIIKHRLDLTDEQILSSPAYIVNSNDIIYVEPLRQKRWGFESFPYTLVLTVTNTALLLYTFMLTVY